MKTYELTYLISPDLSEEEVKLFQGKINSSIQEAGGIPEKTSLPVKKRLAYPIEKKNQAYLITLNFQLNPEGLAILEKQLKSEGQILRYLILSKKKPKVIKVSKRLPMLVKPPGEISLLQGKKAVKPKVKVELKEIEKKLEEILNE